MKIAFRVDGNSIIGFGHLFRCLSVAIELIKNIEVHEIVFFTETKEILKFVDHLKFKIVLLEKNNTELEIKEISNFCSVNKCKILVVDSYNYTNQYFDIIRASGIKVVYFDDFFNGKLNVDILINGNIFALDSDYEAMYGDSAKLLIGPDYLSMKSGFSSIPLKKQLNNPLKLLITTGSTDNSCASLNILDQLNGAIEAQQYEITFLIGGFYKVEYIEKLKSMNCMRYNFVSDILNMNEFLSSFDICFSAGGITTYELLRSGVLTFSFVIAENQLKSVEALINRGITFPLNLENINSVLVMIKEMVSNGIALNKIIENQKLVDGQGARRISEVIIEFSY